MALKVFISQDMKELIIAGSFLIAFIGFLMINGTLIYSDLAMAIGAYIISWCIVSYCVKRFGAGSMDKNSLLKELIWFGVILIVFLAFLTLVSQEDGGLSISVYVIVTTAFAITWVIRSYAVKRFAAQKVKQK